MISPSEAKSVSQKIAAAHARKEHAEQSERYAEYRAEARACGYEVESFEEFTGATNAKDNRTDELIASYSACPHSYLDA